MPEDVYNVMNWVLQIEIIFALEAACDSVHLL